MDRGQIAAADLIAGPAARRVPAVDREPTRDLGRAADRRAVVREADQVRRGRAEVLDPEVLDPEVRDRVEILDRGMGRCAGRRSTRAREVMERRSCRRIRRSWDRIRISTAATLEQAWWRWTKHTGTASCA